MEIMSLKEFRKINTCFGRKHGSAYENAITRCMTKRIKEKGIRTNGEHEKKPRVRVRVYPMRTGTGTHVKDSLLSF